ncbi:MAG: cytochrome C [Acidobacteria bacterium]|nr:MAG: cytochrome C [Acidobacteriota bacterium]
MKKLFLPLSILALATALVQAGTPDQAVMEKGKKIYMAYCFTCHQPTGLGIPGAFPPLAKSDYLTKNDKATVIKSVVLGLQGEIVVNGAKYNSVMTPLPPNYSSADAAAVLTYVYNSWGNPGGVVTEAEVEAVKKAGK